MPTAHASLPMPGAQLSSQRVFTPLHADSGPPLCPRGRPLSSMKTWANIWMSPFIGVLWSHTLSTVCATKLTAQSSRAVAGTAPVRHDGFSLNKIAFRRRF